MKKPLQKITKFSIIGAPQAYCLADKLAGVSAHKPNAAADEMIRFLVASDGGVMPVSLADAVSGHVLAQGGVDLRAVCASGEDVEHGELPLEGEDGDALAVLGFSLSVCAAVSQLTEHGTLHFCRRSLLETAP